MFRLWSSISIGLQFELLKAQQPEEAGTEEGEATCKRCTNRTASYRINNVVFIDEKNTN